MAESIMTHLVKNAQLHEHFHIASAATSREEIGNSVHYGTVAKLQSEGIPLIPHRAIQMTARDCAQFDYLIAMDHRNIKNMTNICPTSAQHKIYRLLDWSAQPRDIADPWYTGDFTQTYLDIQEGCRDFLAFLLKQSQS